MNPLCAACHLTMDPIGYGLENFDGMGAWRQKKTGAAPGWTPAASCPEVRRFDGAWSWRPPPRIPALERCLDPAAVHLRPGAGPTQARLTGHYLERIAALSAGHARV